MTKKYAICNVHLYDGQIKPMVLDHEEYCLSLCQCDLIFESDSFKEVSDKFNAEYL